MLVETIQLLQEATRPVFVVGAGGRDEADLIVRMAEAMDIPCVCSWGAIDAIPHYRKVMVGGFGTHGTRASNFTVQNADLVISLGCRLDTKATGHPPHFARSAKVVMVDIDIAELKKFEKLGREILPVYMTVRDFLIGISASTSLVPKHDLWMTQIQDWKAQYDNPPVDWEGLNPYQLMKEIGTWTTPEDVIVSDTGTVLGYLMQAFPFKGERFLHAFNMTPMGYGLPAAIGASLATGRRTILVTGDGSIMMSLSELATIKRWNLNIKIILLNNHGHRMCVQTENQWFGGVNASTTPETGLGFPNFQETASSFGMTVFHSLSTLMSQDGAGFLEIEVPREAHLIPQCRFGAPLEDGEPLLPRDEFRAQMIVPPL